MVKFEASLGSSGMDRMVSLPSPVAPRYPEDLGSDLLASRIARIEIDANFLKKHLQNVEVGMEVVRSENDRTDQFSGIEKEADTAGRVVGAGMYGDDSFSRFNYTDRPTAEERGWLSIDDKRITNFFSTLEDVRRESTKIALDCARKCDAENANRGLYSGSLEDMLRNGRVVVRIGDYAFGQKGGPDEPRKNECCFAIQWWASAGKIRSVNEDEVSEAALARDRTIRSVVEVIPGKELAALISGDTAPLYRVEPTGSERCLFLTVYVYPKIPDDYTAPARSDLM